MGDRINWSLLARHHGFESAPVMIREVYRESRSVDEAGRKVGTSGASFYKKMVELGIPRRPRQRPMHREQPLPKFTIFPHCHAKTGQDGPPRSQTMTTPTVRLRDLTVVIQGGKVSFMLDNYVVATDKIVDDLAQILNNFLGGEGKRLVLSAKYIDCGDDGVMEYKPSGKILT